MPHSCFGYPRGICYLGKSKTCKCVGSINTATAHHYIPLYSSSLSVIKFSCIYYIQAYFKQLLLKDKYFPLFHCSLNPKTMDGQKQHMSFFSLNGLCFSQSVCWTRASLNSVYKLAIKFINAPLFPNLIIYLCLNYIKCFYIS